MSNGYWNQDEDDFRDIPEETQEGGRSAIPVFPSNSPHAAAPKPTPSYAPPPVVEPEYEILEEPVDLEEDDYSAVLSDASLRLEQGNLYKLIMNHDLFAGVDADPRAVKQVQKEIKKFAKEKMEEMLGMRKKKEETTLVSPFNDLEIEILKKFCSRATGGVTEKPEANQVATAIKEVPKKQTLNAIGTPRQETKSAPKPTPTPSIGKKLTSTPSAPVKREKKNPMIVDGVVVPSEELEYKGIGKPASELTEEERLERNKEAAVRQAGRKAAKPANALPPASYDQEYYLAQQHTLNAGNSPAVERLVGIINAMPQKR